MPIQLVDAMLQQQGHFIDMQKLSAIAASQDADARKLSSQELTDLDSDWSRQSTAATDDISLLSDRGVKDAQEEDQSESDSYSMPFTASTRLFCTDFLHGTPRASYKSFTKFETLIAFDWDDTLCPSSHLGLHPQCAHLEAERLETWRGAVVDLLRHAADHGQVIIVTSAVDGWVEKCMKQLAAMSLRDLFAELGIQVFGARSAAVPTRTFREAGAECRDPNQFLKKQALLRAIKEFYVRGNHAISCKNILSIGDSSAERLALQDVAFNHMHRKTRGQSTHCRCKTLLMYHAPDLDLLINELKALTAWFSAFVKHDGDFDLDIDLEGGGHACA
mmetsp:Transcript_63683/g.136870  ORF Transcript_63683/g.136870 Transcript_63683/m.136870 type:complete len:333 (-) Transcript_63683:233-1231(-)